MLSEQQKIEIRRHLGYPVTGNPITSPVGQTLSHGFIGWRFHQVYGLLEWRMNNLQPFEEAILFGLATAGITVQSVAAPGGTITLPNGLVVSLEMRQPVGGVLQADGVTILYDVDETVSYTTVSSDTIFSVGAALSSLVLANGVLVGAGFWATSPYNVGAYAEAAKPPATVQPFPGIQITCIPDAFEIIAVSAPPLFLAVQPGSGQFLPPNATFGDPATLHRGYIPILDALETEVANASDNLDTLKADVWTARPDEIHIREALYNRWRRKMAQFLALPLWEDTEYDVTRTGSGGRGQMVA